MKTLQELEKANETRNTLIFKNLYESDFWPWIVAYFDEQKLNASISLANVNLDEEPHKASKIQGILQGLEYLAVKVSASVASETKEEDE